jgi:hypothetical protein
LVSTIDDISADDRDEVRSAVLAALRHKNVQVSSGAAYTLRHLSSSAAGLATGKPIFIGR